MTSHLKTTTLHELVTKSFCRTPNGLIFTYDLKTVFSVLLICLNIQGDDKKPKKWLPNFYKSGSYMFSFSVDQAIEKMKNLELQVDIGTTYVNISYKIHPELAYHLLETFMAAKLLHTPADRTRAKLKDKVLLQPTPKGVNILQKYVKDIGLKDIPKVLLSELNSMDLFLFERNSLTDSIIHSDYLVCLLFNKIMGASPNVWSPVNSSNKIPPLSKLLECNTDEFSFETAEYKPRGVFTDFMQGEYNDAYTCRQDKQPGITLKIENRTSPLAHKFFTNPASDSHIQYYVSDSGLRVFKSKIFGSENTLIDFCFTTKALWQWIMDCTDVLYPKEAVSVAALFLKAGLIVPIYLPPSKSSKKRFHISKSAYYTLTQRGWSSIQWNSEMGIKRSIVRLSLLGSKSLHLDFSNRPPMEVDRVSGLSCSESCSRTKSPSRDLQFKSLDDILSDPGMRYLFRRHLEKEFCSENLDAFIKIEKFLKRMTLLRKATNYEHFDRCESWACIRSSENNVTASVNSALSRHINECLELAYHIYSSYIMVNSPYELNIDHKLRESINIIMLHPSHLNSKDFPLRPDLKDEIFEDAKSASISPLESPLLDFSSDVNGKSFVATTSPEPKVEGFLRGKFSTAADAVPSGHNQSLAKNSEHHRVLSSFHVLSNLCPKFETLLQDLHRLMRVDSLQKFVNSDTYRGAIITFVEAPNCSEEVES